MRKSPTRKRLKRKGTCISDRLSQSLWFLFNINKKMYRNEECFVCLGTNVDRKCRNCNLHYHVKCVQAYVDYSANINARNPVRCPQCGTRFLTSFPRMWIFLFFSVLFMSVLLYILVSLEVIHMNLSNGIILTANVCVMSLPLFEERTVLL